MTGVQVRFTEEDKEAITERFRELARFEQGDRVTVEPADHDIAYAGQEYEGAPLTVDDVWWNSNTLSAVREGGRHAPEHSDYSEAHYVELQGDYDHYVHDRVLLLTPKYSFTEEYARPMSESALIPWEEYREEYDRIILLGESPSDHEKHWLAPFENGECEVCGCNMAKHWHYDNGVQSAGGHECAACGDVKVREGP